MKLIDRVSRETGKTHEEILDYMCALQHAELKTVYCEDAACDTCWEQEDPLTSEVDKRKDGHG